MDRSILQILKKRKVLPTQLSSKSSLRRHKRLISTLLRLPHDYIELFQKIINKFYLEKILPKNFHNIPSDNLSFLKELNSHILSSYSVIDTYPSDVLPRSSNNLVIFPFFYFSKNFQLEFLETAEILVMVDKYISSKKQFGEMVEEVDDMLEDFVNLCD